MDEELADGTKMDLLTNQTKMLCLADIKHCTSPQTHEFENLWLDLTELEWVSEEDWSKIAAPRCGSLIDQRLCALIAAEGASTTDLEGEYLCNHLF